MTGDVAGYVRVSTDDQDDDRQRESILNHYDQSDIDWYVDIESGVSASREQYQELRDAVESDDPPGVVVTTELDRLGRSFSELASFVESLRERDIDLDCTQQPISTADTEDDWMGDIMLKLMIVFADAERQMIRDRVQQGIDKARRDGKRVGRPPFGYDVEDGFLCQKPAEFARAQEFVREVRKGRAKKRTAEFFEIPESSIQSILERSERNYETEFDNDEWRVRRARVESGEKNLEPLEKVEAT